MASHPECCGTAVTSGGHISDGEPLSFTTWCNTHRSVAPKSIGLLHNVRGSRTGPPRRMEGESDDALALRRRQHFEHAEQVILSQLDPSMRCFCREVGPASRVRLPLLVDFGHALEIWRNFSELPYDPGESPSDIKNLCSYYQETVELLKYASVVLDPAIQSFQFLDYLEKYFPEWYREKQHLIDEYTQPTSKTSEFPKLEDLVKVVLLLATE